MSSIEGEHGYCPNCSSGLLRKNGSVNRVNGLKRKYLCRECHRGTTNPLPSQSDLVMMKTSIAKSKKYIITSAQNATPVHKKFWTAIERYAKYNDAEIIVIPLRYKNPTSQWTEESQEHEWWDSKVLPYLFNGKQDIGSIRVLGDIKVLPTAVTPLTGLDAISGELSGIIGHPKIQLTTIATPHHSRPKIMTTTGACTTKNYTDSKAGKKGEFHHSFGACVVEVRGKTFHLRQISACDDGSFIDLDREYTQTGTKKAPRAEALIIGDTHVDFVDPAVVRATFGEGGMVEALNPKRLIYHDLLDFYSRNHHHNGDPFVAIAKQQSGRDNVREEVERAIDFVMKYEPKNTESILVASNHNDALSRWINEANWKNDSINAEFYLETALAMCRSVKMTPHGSVRVHPFVYWCDKIAGDNINSLGRDESYSVKGIELSLHGDKGSNGARGSAFGISKIGVKTIIGHSHSPNIRDGCYQTGTSTHLKLEYNSGASSWLQTHCVIYANGKRSLINIINGKWRI